jgi:flagellar biosynthesis component FlhA
MHKQMPLMPLQRPFVMFIVPIVLVGVGAFFAITVAQVLRKRMLDQQQEQQEQQEQKERDNWENQEQEQEQEQNQDNQKQEQENQK